MIRTLNLRHQKTEGHIEPHRKNLSNFRNYKSSSMNLTTVASGQKKFDSKYCKLCTCNGHTILYCHKYANYNSRRSRCLELGLCPNCSSQKHTESLCPKKLDFNCNFCQSKEHISALCKKYVARTTSSVCLNNSNSGQTFVLPCITVILTDGIQKTMVNC